MSFPGCRYAGEMRSNGGQRSPASGQVFNYRPDGNRVSASSVRPAAVADGLPEQVEATAPLLMFNSLAAAVGEQLELCCHRSSRNVEDAKQVEPLRQVDLMGREIRVSALFLFGNSVAVVMHRWMRVPRLGLDTGRSAPCAPGLWFRLARRKGNPQSPQPG